jgi:hypothetical protein
MLARVVEGKLADGDVRGAIRILCSDDILAPRNIKTLTALQDKHPKARSFDSTPFQAPTLQITSVTAKEVMQSVHSFPSGSSGGLDGLRPQHLKDLLAETNGESSNLLAKALASLADIMLAGKVPKEICPILYGASLTALNKKDGGIRPIAVGCTLRRLVAKIGCQRSQIESGNILRPKQFGFGTKGGAEAIIHAVRRYVNQESKSTLVLLKLDFKNAFNAITRDNMLEQVRSKLPNLYPFMSQCYQDATILSYGKETILSECGCQQGDPLGPLLFCLAIQPLVSSLQSPLNTWYMDDGTLDGSIDQVMEDVKLIQLAAFNLGLELNTNKCEIFLLNHNKQEENKSLSRLHHCLPGARVAQQDEWRLLGAPLTNEAIPGVLHEKIKALETFSDRLGKLNSHSGLYLLKNCLAIPKLMYVLRTSPCFLHPNILQIFDNLIKTELIKISNCDIRDRNWSQSTLPVRYGGIGIRRTVELALPAFLASVHSVKPLIDIIMVQEVRDKFLEAGLSLWSSNYNSFPDESKKGTQCAWDETVILAAVKIHQEKLKDIQTKAHFESLCCKEAGAWLQALPSPQLGTFLDNDTLRIAIGLRLGCEICLPHLCICGSSVDAFGLHGLSCRRSAGRWSRHHSLNEIIQSALNTAGFPSRLEPPGTSRDDGKRPDGMTLVPWKKGKMLVWDATCVDNLAPSHIQSTAMDVGSTSRNAEIKKKKNTVHYRTCLQSPQWHSKHLEIGEKRAWFF